MNLPIAPEIEQEIQDALDRIEQDQDVKVLFACESGSRAWGFASTDSDYDVRFIYVRRPDWYLDIDLEHKRDVIELPINDDLDVSGWDLRKALQLYRKSNPPLLEWLGSPIIYREEFSIAQQMRDLASTCYSPIACQYHYYKMAKGNYKDYLKQEMVKLKKYLYVLRPVLGVIWLEQDMGVVPTEFQKLVDGVIDDPELEQAIERLLEIKMSSTEKDVGPRMPVINEFLERELSRMEAQEFERKVGNCPLEKLNQLFRGALAEVWHVGT